MCASWTPPPLYTSMAGCVPVGPHPPYIPAWRCVCQLDPTPLLYQHGGVCASWTPPPLYTSMVGCVPVGPHPPYIPARRGVCQLDPTPLIYQHYLPSRFTTVGTTTSGLRGPDILTAAAWSPVELYSSQTLSCIVLSRHCWLVRLIGGRGWWRALSQPLCCVSDCLKMTSSHAANTRTQ